MTLAKLRYPDPPLWAAADAEAVLAACSDPVTQRFISGLPRPYTLDDAKQFIASADEHLNAGTRIALAIAVPDAPSAIGAITLRTDGSPTHWYVGYWVTPAARGKGIASAALRALSGWAFEEYPELARISLYTDPENAASQRVAERAGYRREGLLRSWDQSASFPEDIVMFSLIRSDLEPSP